MSKETKFFNRNTGILIVGLSISGIGTFLFQFSLAIWILHETGLALRASLPITMAVLGRVIFAPIATSYVESVNKKKIVVITDMVLATVFTTTTVLFMYGGLTFEEKYLVVLGVMTIAGIATPFNQLSSQTLLRIMTPKHLLHKLYAVIGFLDTFRMMGIMALAGFIYAFIGIDGIAFVVSVSLIIAVFIELMINFKERLPEKKVTFNAAKQYKDFFKGTKIIRSDKDVWSLFKLTIMMMIFAPIQWQVGNKYFLLSMAGNGEGISASMYGLIGGLAAGFSLLGPVIVYFMSKKRALKVSRYVYLFLITPTVIAKGAAVIFTDNPDWVPFIANVPMTMTILWVVAHFVMRPSGQITAISRHTAMNTAVKSRDLPRLKGMISFYSEINMLWVVPLAGFIIDIGHITGLYFFTTAWGLIVGYSYFTNKTLLKASNEYKEEKTKTA